METKYKETIFACFISYIIQAIVNNFAPLLFLTFSQTYAISLEKITALITINFFIQLVVDMASTAFVDRIGYRASMIVAHIAAAFGLIGMAVLPEIMPNPFVGLLLSVFLYACGGGLLEVLVSPIVEACPSDNKEKTMSLLHSFYCWGHVGVVLISTAFFAAFGIEKWKYLAVAWAILPILNTFIFAKVPMAELVAENETKLGFRGLFGEKIFWVFFVMMLCAGASEQAVSQWVSAFAEKGLGVSKTLGDLCGTMMFAAAMGASRAYYGKFGENIKIDNFMIISSALCVVSYLMIALFPSAVVSLLGCALCGLSVGIMWPGTYSRASATIPGGGTAMFAMLALAGDIGCTSGPTLVGYVSGISGDNLKLGIFCAVVFPIGILAALLATKRK